MLSLYLQLKKEYKEVKQVRDFSGFGWDSVNHVATASDDVWTALLTVRFFISNIYPSLN